MGLSLRGVVSQGHRRFRGHGRPRRSSVWSGRHPINWMVGLMTATERQTWRGRRIRADLPPDLVGPSNQGRIRCSVAADRRWVGHRCGRSARRSAEGLQQARLGRSASSVRREPERNGVHRFRVSGCTHRPPSHWRPSLARPSHLGVPVSWMAALARRFSLSPAVQGPAFRRFTTAFPHHPFPPLLGSVQHRLTNDRFYETKQHSPLATRHSSLVPLSTALLAVITLFTASPRAPAATRSLHQHQRRAAGSCGGFGRLGRL